MSWIQNSLLRDPSGENRRYMRERAMDLLATATLGDLFEELCEAEEWGGAITVFHAGSYVWDRVTYVRAPPPSREVREAAMEAERAE